MSHALLTVRTANAGRFTSNILALVTFWAHRRRTRRALEKLDANLLRDIGLDPAEARDEAAKYFWQD